MAKEFLSQVEQAGANGLTSDEHFTMDGHCWKRGQV
jgi:hypothetical protein